MKRYVFTNDSDRVQVIKTRIRHWERTLFPGQAATFEANPEDFLEIYTYQVSSALLADRTPCSRLPTPDEARVGEPSEACSELLTFAGSPLTAALSDGLRGRGRG
ncbi:MAG: DUF1830 domain-containing protein [Cyanobacteriota bacterium]|nr:DUF1830 domain-containing protein [Cyanobacteriota bacterium]